MNCRCATLSALIMLLSCPALGLADWPFTSNGPRHGSEEYYEMRAHEPIGQRQRYHHGKYWPPFPRPIGKPLPWIHRFHALHYWPYPYTGMDQADVNLVSNMQIHNGWQCMTTFFEYHFDPLTHTLNSPGQEHLKWLLANVPVEHRQAYLEMSPDSSVNDQRLASLQEAVSALTGDPQALPVTLRVTSPLGRPAHEIDTIFKQRIENMDPPVIPFTKAAAGGEGSTQ